MTRTRWQVCFLVLALVAFVALAHQVGTAVSEQRAVFTEPPCPKSVEESFQRPTDTIVEIGRQPNPVCDDLWRKFRTSPNLATAKWIASQARHQRCWR